MTSGTQTHTIEYSTHRNLRRLPVGDEEKNAMAGKCDSGWKHETTSLEQLRDNLAQGVAIAPVYRDGKRSKKTTDAIHFIPLDLDNHTSPSAVDNHDFFKDLKYIVGSSPSSTPHHPKCRVIIPLDRPITNANLYEQIMLMIFHEIADLEPDTACKDIGRFYFGLQPDTYIHDGHMATLDELKVLMEAYQIERAMLEESQPEPPELPERRESHESRSDGTQWANAALDGEVSLVAGAIEGQRHDTLIKASFRVGQILHHGINESYAFSALMRAARAVGLSEKEATRTITDGITAGREQPRAPEPRTITPPQSPQESPNGSNGSHAPQAIIPAQSFKLIPEADLNQYKPIDWLVPNLIARQELTVIYAPPESFKTFYALDLAYRVAQHEPVIYITPEGFAGMPARRAAWYQHHRKQSGQMYFLDVPVRLMNGAETDLFISAIRHLKPALVVFDTLAYAITGGEENSAKDMQIVVDNATRIRKETGAATIFVHHSRKADSIERGSSALRGAAYVMIQLKNYDGSVAVECTKTKDESRFETYYLSPLVLNTDFDPSIVLIDADQVIRTSDELTQSERRILETLNLSIFNESGARATVLLEESGVSKTSFYRVISALKDRHLLRQSSRGDPYFITAAGQLEIGAVQTLAERQDEYE